MKAICDNCMNWEDPAESKLIGLERTPKFGYCTLFQKETTRNDRVSESPPENQKGKI